MKSLKLLKDKPKFIILENVKGFCNSESHVEWTETLIECGYSWRQYLLTPFQFRIPNNRMRFYMIIIRDDFITTILADNSNSSTRSQDELLSNRDGYSKDISIVYNSIRTCNCVSTERSVINSKSLDTSYVNLEAVDGSSTSLNKLHELGEDDITGPSSVNDLSHYIVPQHNIGIVMTCDIYYHYHIYFMHF
jgi:hypothetical protein